MPIIKRNLIRVQRICIYIWLSQRPESCVQIWILTQQKKWIFREPSRTDGDDVYALITECPPLDINSSYCNFLQATHFSKTCVLAEKDGDLAGFISGYQKPDEPNTLFIWQVAVSPRYRGKGLAFSMLTTLLERKKTSAYRIYRNHNNQGK